MEIITYAFPINLTKIIKMHFVKVIITVLILFVNEKPTHDCVGNVLKHNQNG